MMAADQLLLELIEAFEGHRSDTPCVADVVVTDIALDLPVETQIHKGATLCLSLPRGRLNTGFRVPHGRIHARLQRSIEHDG
ncbi:MAG: hypothetical protein JXA30_22790 [Deltaproteobacteria bacterium]|nr:hypothetical protein [Deltaproteobacteria bacterium]